MIARGPAAATARPRVSRQATAAPARASRRAAAARPEPAPRPRTAPARTRAPQPRRAAATRARPRLGRLAIPLVALLLGGIVWVNVAKLALTTETARVVERARGVESDTVRLRSLMERQSGTVNARARTRLGMVDPPSQSVVILDAPTAGP